ncbi:DUF1836 domain-containing protein [Lachnoclostridium phytofermentans]|uniref:DUF1836 domain-containing protein n=1 Tax=Lachnoclostridium phytofermentans TaxID=66219 RepID=UPI00069092ED|nr:DUF1836 domain-containing protein [Lachnoclostridium phytofermentans]
MGISFPGTVIERHNLTSREFFGVFRVTKGLMLAQVREITGLDTTTIQNWINRGWVKNPIDKRYSENQLASILLIHMLRDVMKLDHIAKLFNYLKKKEFGDSEETLLISEAELYHCVCDMLDNIDYDIILTPKELEKEIFKKLSTYVEPYEGAKKRLVNVLKIILVYYASAIVKREADLIFADIMKE